ncbi:MAG: hypothetical protein WCR63_02870 [Bacilli bacterium]
MKIKSKLILAASSLLVLSGVAAGTSTFAWFTANQSSTVDVTSIGVYTNTNELSMAVTPQDSGVFTTNSGDTTDYSYAADSAVENSSLTDVSGNGVNLYKGNIQVEQVGDDEAQHITGSYLVEEKAAPYCFDFDITFSVSNSEEAMAIFLSSESKILAANSENAADESLANSMRVAILNSDENESLAYYAPNETDASSLSQIITDSKASYLTGHGLSSEPPTDSELGLTTNIQNILTGDYDEDYTDGTGSPTSKAKGYLGQVSSGEDAEFTVTARIWLEGTDSDCNTTALSGNVSVNLVFNGVSNIVTA